MIISFKELADVPVEQLRTLKAADLTDSLIDALTTETDKCAVLHFAFTKCIDAVTLVDIGSIYDPIWPYVQDIFETGSQEDELLSTYDTFTKLVYALLTSVTGALERQSGSIRFICLGGLTLFCMDFVEQISQFISNSVGLPIENLSQCVRNTQILLLVLLESDKLIVEACADDLIHMEKILVNVAALAQLYSQSDEMKPIAGTWKCLMKLAGNFRNCLDNTTYMPSLEWLEQCVQTLCECLQQFLNNFRAHSCNAKSWKLSMFYGKILVKLFMDLSTQLERANGQRRFIEILRAFHEIRVNHLDNQQIMSLSETLLAALKLIIGHEVTAELLLNGTGTGNYSICIDVAKELIQTTAHDDLYLANERNLLQFLIVNSEADVHSLWSRKGKVYEEVVLYSTAVIITRVGCGNRLLANLEKTIATAVLNESIHVGYLALDIWTLYIRHIPANELLQYYDYWTGISTQISRQCNCVSYGLVKTLVRNLYVTMPSSMQKISNLE